MPSPTSPHSTAVASAPTWTRSSTRTRPRVPEIRPGGGLLDTSVLIDLGSALRLPSEAAISALSLAELAAGPHAAADAAERAARQQRVQFAEASFDALPFDDACARAYGGVFAAVAGAGRKPRGRRMVDLLIAATAIAHALPLYTFNARDFDGMGSFLEVLDAGAA
ncbi:MAG: PIN domain-containing protein [Actinobacteria bacterium]|nr:PIN domain-containing protein [Actinomycetota bacterium]